MTLEELKEKSIECRSCKHGKKTVIAKTDDYLYCEKLSMAVNDKFYCAFYTELMSFKNYAKGKGKRK